jgi:hypothetical protein
MEISTFINLNPYFYPVSFIGGVISANKKKRDMYKKAIPP